MVKTFRSWDVDQSWLLPPSVHEFVPPDHLAHFVRDTVREALDLSAILDTYPEERGFPPYHPGMMVALLLSGYSRSIYSLNCSEFPGGGLAWVTQPKIESSSARSSGPRPRRVGCSRSARAGVGC
jgi:hypothetical protein